MSLFHVLLRVLEFWEFDAMLFPVAVRVQDRVARLALSPNLFAGTQPNRSDFVVQEPFELSRVKGLGKVHYGNLHFCTSNGRPDIVSKRVWIGCS